MRVLLVEDEAPLRETLAARLKRDGFAVDAAGDGEEAFTSAARYRSTSRSSTLACPSSPAWISSSSCAKPGSAARS